MYNFYTLDGPELLLTDLVDGIMFQKHTLDFTEINYFIFFSVSVRFSNIRTKVCPIALCTIHLKPFDSL